MTAVLDPASVAGFADGWFVTAGDEVFLLTSAGAIPLWSTNTATIAGETYIGPDWLVHDGNRVRLWRPASPLAVSGPFNGAIAGTFVGGRFWIGPSELVLTLHQQFHAYLLAGPAFEALGVPLPVQVNLNALSIHLALN